MNKLLTKAAAYAVLLLLLLLPPAPVQGQEVGVYRPTQGRRVGSVTLPTPPFNPHAGILGSRRGRGADSRKAAPRRAARRRGKATNRTGATKTSRKRVIRRR